VLDASLHAAQFTPEQWGLIEVELQRRLAPLQQQSERDRQQNMEFQVSNHALVMELTALHALDQGPRDLFPPEWEDHRDFESVTVVDRRGLAAGSYTEMRVDGRQNNVSFLLRGGNRDMLQPSEKPR
jgi:hypothetical protein